MGAGSSLVGAAGPQPKSTAVKATINPATSPNRNGSNISTSQQIYGFHHDVVVL